MTQEDLRNLIVILNQAEDGILDLPDKIQEEMVEENLDWITNANSIRDTSDFLEKFNEVLKALS